MADHIEVPLGLDHFEVVSTDVVDDQLEVVVRSTFPRGCFHCGSVDVVGHGRTRRRLRDRAHGYPTILVWDQRRYRCRDCGQTSRERHPETLGAKRVTARFRDALAAAACSRPWSDVATAENVSWWRVADSFDAWAENLDPTTGSAPRVVSLDEASFKRKLVYHTVVSAPEQRRVLELVNGRSQKSARDALLSLPADWFDAIETVVIDMFWPFRQAIEDALPNARIVVDKFHVLRAVDQAAHKVRIRNARLTGTPDSNRRKRPRFDQAVYRARWVFSRRIHRLNRADQDTMNRIAHVHPEIAVAYWLKEAFAHIYQADNRTEAEHRLDTWIHHLQQADIPELTNCWHGLSKWREQILNYYDDPQTNAYAEGITNKIKVLKRRSYGHTNPHRYRNKVLAISQHHTD